jgi:phospholipid/cholesterol/gamma-HCH transport system substrate-binding protein
MSAQERSRNLRIGLVVTSALTLLMVFIFFIGSEQKLFAKKYKYEVLFESATGLAEGNPVQMAGVTIGVVQNIRLPFSSEDRMVEIEISVDRKYAERIREDSRAKLRKLGLIASDSYIDVSPGSPDKNMLEPGSLIPAARQTDVDQLIGQGEDLVDNFVQISVSLRNVLERVDRGEGLLGELTTQPEVKSRVTDTLLETLTKVSSLVEEIEKGKGLAGRLVADEEFATSFLASLGTSMSSIETIATTLETSFEDGTGAVPALLNDPEQRDRVVSLVANLDEASKNIAVLSRGFTGDGMLPRLVNDEEYAAKTLAEFSQLTTRLNEVSRQLAEGDGTAGRIIQDPAIYESINDVLIGINESAMLRWLVKRSQERGIEKRFDAEQKSGEATNSVTPPTEAVPEVEPLVPVEPADEAPPDVSPEPNQTGREPEPAEPVVPPAVEPGSTEPPPDEAEVAPIEPEPVETDELPATTTQPEEPPAETSPPA